MLILSKYIVKNELKPLLKHVSLDDIVIGARKIKDGLGIHLQALNSSQYRFFKVRIGRSAKARMIVFMHSDNGKIIPVLIRLKKDKKFGMNMAANNPAVAEQVDRNLSHIILDLDRGDYEEIKF
jgi:hypothetical protein